MGVGDRYATMYPKGSLERAKLLESCEKMLNTEWDIPCVVGGQEYRDVAVTREIPHDNKRVLCKYHNASRQTMEKAIATAIETHHTWRQMPMQRYEWHEGVSASQC